MDELVREIVIDATPETIWPFLVDPTKHVEWMGTVADLDPRPGGAYRVLVAGRFPSAGTYVEVVPTEKVVFTFGWAEEDQVVPPGSTTVEINLQPEGGKTRLQLIHRGLPDGAGDQHGHGWAHYLERLDVRSRGGDPGPDHGPFETPVTDPVTLHDRALEAAVSIVANVELSQLGLPTPCADFDVRALLDHVMEGNHRFTAIANGVPARPAPTADVERDGVLAPFRESADAVGAAWRDPAVLERTVRLPIGDVPGAYALRIHTVEAIVHGWDLAKATGQPTELDPQLYEAAWQASKDVGEHLRGEGRPFGPAVNIQSGSDTERLMAWLGRQP